MRPFTYTRPTDTAEAIPLLDGRSLALAGGTDLLTLMKSEIATPERLVDVKRLDLPSGISAGADGGLSIGALTTLTEIERSELLAQRLPALSQAAGLAATPQLRNRATIGGNLLQRPRCWYFREELFTCWLQGGESCPARDGQNQFHALFGYSPSGDGPHPCVAVHPSDPAVALLAADASVRLRGREGERSLPLADFFALPSADRRRETVCREDELLLSVEIPATTGRSVYKKAMDRKVWAFALASVAAVAQMDGPAFGDVRIVLGGVAPVPWRVPAAEELLGGQAPDERLFARAADAALTDARPLARNGYKLPLLRGLIGQALAELAGG